jgi:hypothetical protein
LLSIFLIHLFSSFFFPFFTFSLRLRAPFFVRKDLIEKTEGANTEYSALQGCTGVHQEEPCLSGQNHRLHVAPLHLLVDAPPFFFFCIKLLFL